MVPGGGLSAGVNFLVWDVGGQEKLRPLWKSYTRCTDGIIFVVDSCDTERLEEAKMELTRTARSPDNAGVPILILANKQDLPGKTAFVRALPRNFIPLSRPEDVALFENWIALGNALLNAELCLKNRRDFKCTVESNHSKFRGLNFI